MFLLTKPAIGVEYQGENIDGRKFPARAFYQRTGGLYEVQIQFKKTLATLYFNDGSQTTIKLGAATITDPSNIIGFGRLGHVHINNWFSIGLESEPLDAWSGADIWRIRLEPGVLCL